MLRCRPFRPCSTEQDTKQPLTILDVGMYVGTQGSMAQGQISVACMTQPFKYSFLHTCDAVSHHDIIHQGDDRECSP